MPATDTKQIFNFENAFERATRAVLQAAGYEDTFIQGANQTLPESRIEVMFSTGEAINEAVLENSDHVYDFFSGILSVRIVTVRPEDQASLISGVGDLHSEWAAGVRVALQERVSPYTTSNLPWLAVKTIRPRATTRDLDPRFLEDYTRLDFYVEFGIRSTAWPS